MFIFILIIVFAVLFLAMRGKNNVKKDTPSPVKRKRKTLDEARAEGIKEGITIEKENRRKKK